MLFFTTNEFLSLRHKGCVTRFDCFTIGALPAAVQRVEALVLVLFAALRHSLLRGKAKAWLVGSNPSAAGRCRSGGVSSCASASLTSHCAGPDASLALCRLCWRAAGLEAGPGRCSAIGDEARGADVAATTAVVRGQQFNRCRRRQNLLEHRLGAAKEAVNLAHALFLCLFAILGSALQER